MKILLTGNAGFIGKNLVHFLGEEGHTILGIDRKNSNENDHQNIIHARLPKQSSVDAVIHLAAQVSVPESVKKPNKDATSNIMGTIRLLREYPDVPFIFTSTMAIYGESTHAKESDIPKPGSPYAISKLAAEHYVLNLSKNPLVLRLANVFGEGEDKREYANCYTHFRHDDPITIYGNGMQTRDFVNVNTVMRAIMTGIYTGKTGVFNIGSGSRQKIIDIAKQFANQRNVPIQFKDPRPGELMHSGMQIRKAKRAGLI